MLSQRFRPAVPLTALLLSLFALPTGTLGFAAEPPAPGHGSPLASPPIRTAAEFWAIPTAERGATHEAAIEITATYYDSNPEWRVLWGVDRDGIEAYFPLENTSPRLRSGQRFLVSGPFVPAKGLPLATAKITLLADPPPVVPLPTRGQFMDADHFNGRLVSVEGYVNSQSEIGASHLLLDLAVEGHPATARVQIADDRPIPQVDGAFVRLTGVYVFDGPAGASRPNLWVPRPEDVHILGWLDRDPRFNTPVVPIDQLASATTAVHVAGEVQSQQPGQEVVLRDGTGQVTLLTAMTHPLRRGSRVDAIGLPGTEGLNTVLRESLFRPATSVPAPPAASRGLPLLRLAAQVRQLDLAEVPLGYPTRLSGVVTWSHPGSRILYLLDASGGIAVTLPRDAADVPPPGTRLNLSGRSVPGPFAPAVEAESIVVIENVALPDPRPVTLEQAMTGVEEGQWVGLSGYARAIRPDATWDRVDLSTPAGEFVAVVPRSPRVDSLAGAVLQLSGVARATVNASHQLTGFELWVPSSDEIVVEQPRPLDPFDEPLRSIASLRQFNTPDALDRRVRLAGVVLNDEPGTHLDLQDGVQTLMVLSRDTTAFDPGDRVEVVGFPGRRGGRLILREAGVRRTGHTGEPEPLALDAPPMLRPDLDGRLVRLRAAISEVSRDARGFRLIGHANGFVFEAAWREAAPGLPRDLAPGCLAALTGVYVVQFDENARPRSFDLQLRSARDIAILRRTPWWTAGRTQTVVASLAFAILLGLTWVLALRRRVRHQTAQIRSQFEKAEQLEAELVRSSKLESLGVLAGGIAHDFNNLLGVILGNLSLVLGDHRLGSEDERFLRQSERAAFRARDLTQQLLTFARGGAPVRASVALPDVVREAAGFALHGSKCRGEFDLAADVWPGHVDRGQVSQVVHNIVLNACHAMPAGGVVRLTLRNDPVEPGDSLPLAPGRYVRLDIRDHGSGIGSENLPRIFDPYFTTKRQGSGLGLASAYSIVKKHAGHITVESRLGKGTTFHLWLPAAIGDPAEPALAPISAPQLAGRALIMDDELAVREMASAMLRRLGLEVTATADGDEVIDAYRAALDAHRPFSVVIIDLTVPGAMGGRDAIAELRKLDPDIRAIVSSGYSNDPVMADYRQYGFINRIPKPYRFEQFAEAVASVVNGAGPGATPP